MIRGDKSHGVAYQNWRNEGANVGSSSVRYGEARFVVESLRARTVVEEELAARCVVAAFRTGFLLWVVMARL